MKKIITLSILLVVTTITTAQIRVGDAVIPYKVNFEGEELTLNGAGVRKVLGVETYSGGLYTVNKYTDDRKVLDADESMSIRLVINSKKVTNKRMKKVFKKGFDDAMFGNTQSLDARIDQFLELFGSTTQINDFFDLVYIKGKGIRTFKNGEEVGYIEGRDFKYALFKIWLGDEPACKLIKGGMLGQNG
ncbi:chalcone isomerase family protein [Aquimarina sp. MMG015]|uniref:chalcone isomerase family protein n=1 Tax=unclassified Aquimarina TaxID=2627091 RepID=UPI000E4A37A9|nr:MULTISPECIES: chalcone isomerase family protein [unclassified Aquimarina]AXT55536.1 chalcone isomerase [Aquimarina sp. AD1]MBQ4802516.1 chalcone isomerase family protein [Aquimarina sp. MMG015]RKN30297.1 chalcone isomerase [Aquimarina sp. AD1]